MDILKPGAFAVGYALAKALRRMAVGMPLSVAAALPELAVEQSCGPLAAQLLRDAAAGHVIVPFWSTQQLTIGLLAAERFELRPALERFEVVADDSFGGAIMQALGRGVGVRIRPIHTRGNPERLRDVGAWLRDPAPFFIAVDGGSAYGTVPTGIVRLAARLRSVIWPLAIRARPVARCPGLVAEIPLPRAALALAIAEPMTVDRQSVVANASHELKVRLDGATAIAGSMLCGRMEGVPSWRVEGAA